jgi:acetyltransferase-like isoleucine patch superfamily enzyme/glycosyltransferase involved in cell wall biosynthesis
VTGKGMRESNDEIGLVAEPYWLTVAIPTYNRWRFLRRALEVLASQRMPGTEVLVVDNASPDGTAERVKSAFPNVRVLRQERNVGADQNMLTCLERARGEYVWYLGDDDIPAGNLLCLLRECISRESDLTCVGLKTVWTWNEWEIDKASESRQTGWSFGDRNQYLGNIGVYVTAMSGIVVRRDAVNVDFVRRHFGTSLTPAAFALSAAANGTRCAVSDAPLVTCRSGNSGGYAGLSVFTRNLRHLLRVAERMGFDREVTDRTYREALTGVVPWIIESMSLEFGSVVSATVSSWRYREFYSHVVPALRARLRKSVRGRLRRPMEKLVGRLVNVAYSSILVAQDKAATDLLRRTVAHLGQGAGIRHPVYLKGGRYISIGGGFGAGPGLRIEAWDQYGGYDHEPRIMIGDSVIINNNVHIGAIGQISIGNNVLIGSNILITDHSHGDAKDRGRAGPPVERPLVSKGPVVIEDDVWIGEGACILGGVSVGRGAIIGANAVVVCDVERGTVVAGAPARVVSARQGDS